MRRWILPLCAAVVCASFVTGRFVHDGLADDKGTAPPPVPPAAATAPPAASVDPAKALLARCVYTPSAFEMTVRSTSTLGEKLVVERLEFPSPVKSVDPERNDVVKARLFRTAAPEAALVVFLPGWKHDGATPNLAARFAAESGIQALFMDLPFQGERTPKGLSTGQLTFSDDLDQNEATFAQAAQDVARAVDWFVRERKVDAKRVGILGTSLGGYLAADLYGMDDRFACCTTLIAGGDVAAVVFNGNRLTVRIRDALLARGLDEAAVRDRMRPLDPVTWARAARKDGLLLVAAEEDEIVPLATVKALAAAYGGARLVVLPGVRHVDPKVAEGFPSAIAHFRARLAPAPEAATPPK